MGTAYCGSRVWIRVTLLFMAHVVALYQVLHSSSCNDVLSLFSERNGRFHDKGPHQQEQGPHQQEQDPHQQEQDLAGGHSVRSGGGGAEKISGESDLAVPVPAAPPLPDNGLSVATDAGVTLGHGLSVATDAGVSLDQGLSVATDAAISVADAGGTVATDAGGTLDQGLSVATDGLSVATDAGGTLGQGLSVATDAGGTLDQGLSVATDAGGTLDHDDTEAFNTPFSACLLIMDSNHWLIEWIAYHYHAMPLRQLIIVSDPRSATSPKHILDRWRDKIVIEEWSDGDFLPGWVHPHVKKNNLSNLWLHLTRQEFFYGVCPRYLKEKYGDSSSWVMLTDTDEFARINTYQYPQDPSVLREPGHVGRFLHEQMQLHKRPDSIVDLDDTNVTKCLWLPRMQYVSDEIRDHGSGHDVRDDPSSVRLFDSFNESETFLTTRWVYHNGLPLTTGKSIVNVHTLLDEEIPKKTKSVHNAFPVCSSLDPQKYDLVNSDPTTYLIMNHYLGTFEQYSYRDDPRDAIQGRLEKWRTTGRKGKVIKRDDEIWNWLPGFIQDVGHEEAVRLLRGVGVLEKIVQPPPTANTTAAEAAPEASADAVSTE